MTLKNIFVAFSICHNHITVQTVMYLLFDDTFSLISLRNFRLID